MKCKKCGSENVTVSVVNEVHLKNQHHGIFLVDLHWLVVDSYKMDCIHITCIDSCIVRT